MGNFVPSMEPSAVEEGSEALALRVGQEAEATALALEERECLGEADGLGDFDGTRDCVEYHVPSIEGAGVEEARFVFVGGGTKLRDVDPLRDSVTLLVRETVGETLLVRETVGETLLVREPVGLTDCVESGEAGAAAGAVLLLTVPEGERVSDVERVSEGERVRVSEPVALGLTVRDAALDEAAGERDWVDVAGSEAAAAAGAVLLLTVPEGERLSVRETEVVPLLLRVAEVGPLLLRVRVTEVVRVADLGPLLLRVTVPLLLRVGLTVAVLVGWAATRGAWHASADSAAPQALPDA